MKFEKVITKTNMFAQSSLFWFMGFHFLVDLVCGASVVGHGVAAMPPEKVFYYVSLYNFLAFCTQIGTGALADWLHRDRTLLHVSLGMVLAGAVLVLPSPWTAVVLLGLGNSLFHVSAGRETVRTCWNASIQRHRMGPLGAFVAPGALGIGLGCLLPSQMYLGAVLGIIGLWLLFALRPPLKCPECADSTAHVVWERENGLAELCAGLVVFCVACRAAAGSGAKGTGASSILLSIIGFCVVVLGKISGGFLAERFGWRWVGCLALAVSSLLLIFFNSSLHCLLLGQFTANLMMAVTLFLLVELYRPLPGTMFGMAAAVLFPGNLLARMGGGTAWFSLASLVAFCCFAVVCVLWKKTAVEEANR